MKSSLTLVPLLVVLACGDETAPAAESSTTESPLPVTYSFESRFTPGEPSVAYSGQVLRNVLIADMFSYTSSLTSLVDGDEAPSNLAEDLLFYYDFGEVGNEIEIELAFVDIPNEQIIYNDISNAKNLSGKIAGNDPIGQSKDWDTEFIGWPGAANPDALIRSWINQIGELTDQRQGAEPPTAPDGTPIKETFVTPNGLDLAQLIQKFQYTAIGFSQAADDYMDNDLEEHGLNVSNTQDEENPYSALEHHWDEAFGYFGASRTYGKQNKTELIELKYDDADESKSVNLQNEAHYGMAVNAAKRDETAIIETQFSNNAWQAFIGGRHLIANASDVLTELEENQLIEFRDQAIEAWEQTIAATAVHYINDVLDDMGQFNTDDYQFEEHAKHWSELKGYAFAFQFNPRSPLSDVDFTEFHALVGVQPVLENAPEAAQTAYRENLAAARELLQNAYDFSPENVEAW